MSATSVAVSIGNGYPVLYTALAYNCTCRLDKCLCRRGRWLNLQLHCIIVGQEVCTHRGITAQTCADQWSGAVA